jgi:hypothetical protein
MTKEVEGKHNTLFSLSLCLPDCYAGLTAAQVFRRVFKKNKQDSIVTKKPEKGSPAFNFRKET